MSRKIAIAAVVVACAAAASPATQARIVCDGPYQINSGNAISTPYCQDNYLTQIARTYGMRVSEVDVRNNPTTKRQVCQLVGYDNRVSSICSGWRNDGGSRVGW